MWGVDPEPAMLEAARRDAAAAGVVLRLVDGRAEDLPGDVGAFDVVTVGRALHWMEPTATRPALDRDGRAQPLAFRLRGGAGALVGAGPPRDVRRG